MQDRQLGPSGELRLGEHVSWRFLSLLAPFVPIVFAVVLIAGAARPAHAQVWIDAGQLDGKLPDWVDPAYVKPLPEHQDRVIVHRHWCEPVYRTVCQRVWHEPVVRVVWNRVWVPPRYEWRDCYCDGHIVRERILIEAGHYEVCKEEIIVCAGHWETVEVRELVAEGHFED